MVKNWMRLKNTIEYLGVWEMLNNPNFKGFEFDPLLRMAMLFQRDRTFIGRHIRIIYKERELSKDITCANFAHQPTVSKMETVEKILKTCII